MEPLLSLPFKCHLGRFSPNTFHSAKTKERSTKNSMSDEVIEMLIRQMNYIKFLYVDEELSRKYLIHQISTKRPIMTGQMGETSFGEDSQCAVEKWRSPSEVNNIVSQTIIRHIKGFPSQ